MNLTDDPGEEKEVKMSISSWLPFAPANAILAKIFMTKKDDMI